MKTLIRLTKFATLPLILLAALTGCGKSDTTATSSTQYVYTNGMCYDSSSGQYVATTYCTTATSTGYYLQNGQCYSSTTGQLVNYSLCTTTTTTTTTGTTGAISQVCNGPYLFSNGYTVQLVTCYGANCRGYVMYTTTTRQPVMCQ